MDVRRAQFLIMVGEIGRQAHLAGFPIEVVTRDDRTYHGVPNTVEARHEEVDSTGLAPLFAVDTEMIALEAVAEIRVCCP